MKMKMSTILVSFLVFSGIAGTTVSAKESVQKEVVLEPETAADEVFEEVKYINDGTEEHVSISGSKKVHEQVEAYTVSVNKEEGTYSVEENEALENEVKAQLSITPMATTSYSGSVKAITDDPVGVDLTSTTASLSWYDYGTTVGYKSKSISAWAANPSSLGTHWYVDSKSISNPVQSSDKRDLKVVGRAAFHNYDFLDNDKITNVRHDITITAQNDGTFDYFVDWVRSGESYITLDLDVVVN